MSRNPDIQDKYSVLSLIDPDESLQRELWEQKLSPVERAQIIKQVRAISGLSNLTESEAKREYFSEGVCNETQWVDSSARAIKLKPEIKLILEERTREVLSHLKV